ncbi:MAG: IS21 family transposase [Myxococcota bacterium]
MQACGHGIKATARKVGVDVKNVRRLIRPTALRKKRNSKLDPFRPVIDKLVCTDGFTAVLVLEEIRALGYRGGYSILKQYVRSIRPRSVRRPHLRFETDPGQQGQVDLSPYNLLLSGVPTPVVCFSLVLGYSRWQFLRFFLHADAHAVSHAHILAFEEAGGVPHQILYDRMKQIVLESYRHRVVMHPLFDAMRRHYSDFRATALAPGYKEGKGKVENPFRYVEGNFLKRHRKSFRDIADLNEKAFLWLRDTARPRKHETTQERPLDRLDVERPHLLPLPAHRFEAAEVVDRIVGGDFCVAWLTNRYSVPPRLVGHSLKVRVLEGWLEVHQDEEVITRHRVRDTEHKRYMLPEHEAEFRERSTSRHVLSEQFLRLGPAARDFIDGLIVEHRGAAGYHMSRILTLSEKVGNPRVAEALRHAVRYGAFDFNAVARIVHGSTDRPAAAPAAPGPVPEQIAQYLRGAGEHQRSLESYEQLVLELSKKESEDGE